MIPNHQIRYLSSNLEFLLLAKSSETYSVLGSSHAKVSNKYSVWSIIDSLNGLIYSDTFPNSPIIFITLKMKSWWFQNIRFWMSLTVHLVTNQIFTVYSESQTSEVLYVKLTFEFWMRFINLMKNLRNNCRKYTKFAPVLVGFQWQRLT